MESRHQQPIIKLYIFDRDDTIADKNNSVINPKLTLNFLKDIAKKPNVIKWAILTAGGSGSIEDDDIYKYYEVIKEVSKINKPLYKNIRVGRLNDKVQSVVNLDKQFHIHCEGDDKDKVFGALQGFFYDDYISLQENDHDLLFLLLSKTDFEKSQKKKPSNIPILIKNDDDSYQFWGFKEGKWQLTNLGKLDNIPWDVGNEKKVRINNDHLFYRTFIHHTDGNKALKGGEWIIQLGKTKIKLDFNINKFDREHRQLLDEGNCKLFGLFEILDEYKLKVKLTEELKQFGIIEINAPDHYQEIDAKDIVFLDDEPKNCALIKTAGFTAIHADTPVIKPAKCNLQLTSTVVEVDKDNIEDQLKNKKDLGSQFANAKTSNIPLLIEVNLQKKEKEFYIYGNTTGIEETKEDNWILTKVEEVDPPIFTDLPFGKCNLVLRSQDISITNNITWHNVSKEIESLLENEDASLNKICKEAKQGGNPFLIKLNINSTYPSSPNDQGKNSFFVVYGDKLGDGHWQFTEIKNTNNILLKLFIEGDKKDEWSPDELNKRNVNLFKLLSKAHPSLDNIMTPVNPTLTKGLVDTLQVGHLAIKNDRYQGTTNTYINKLEETFPKPLGRPVALLDVNGTLLAMGKIEKRNILNLPLIRSLKAQGIKDLYLLTNMNLSTLIDEYNKLNDMNMKRHELVSCLEQEGFIVHGVVTPADVSYGKGLGAVYIDYIEKQRQIIDDGEIGKTKKDQLNFSLTNEDFIKDQKIVFELTEQTKQEQKLAEYGEIDRGEEIDKEKNIKNLGNIKAAMYSYFLQQKPAWAGHVVFVDDEENCIESVFSVHQTQAKQDDKLFIIKVAAVDDKKNDPFENDNGEWVYQSYVKQLASIKQAFSLQSRCFYKKDNKFNAIKEDEMNQVEQFYLMEWHEIRQALDDKLSDNNPFNIDTKRYKSKIAIKDKLKELDEKEMSGQEKIHLLADFIVAEYRAIIRSSHGAPHLFGKGSRLAEQLRKFCEENLFFTLPIELQKGEQLSLEEENNNIVIDPNFHLMIYGIESVNTTDIDRHCLFNEIKNTIIYEIQKYGAKTNQPWTDIMGIIKQSQQDDAILLNAIKTVCFSHLQTKNSMISLISPTTETFCKAICHLNIYDKVSINNAQKILRALHPLTHHVDNRQKI